MVASLNRNDPYRKMSSGRQGVRPEFLLKKERDREDDNSRKNDATRDLRSVEENAGEKKLAQIENGLVGARINEEVADGLYTGAGGANNTKKQTRKKGFLKRKGPMALILGLVGGCGGLMMGMQTLMPMAIEEMIIEKFNSIGISSTMASDAWLDVQLNQGVHLEQLDTGQSDNLFAFSSYQVQQFERQGIKVVDVGGGGVTRVTALLYKKGDVYVPVVGSDVLNSDLYSTQTLVDAIKNASGLENVGMPISANEALLDSDFKTPYTTASKAWRGGASGWFDQIMANFTEVKLSIHRNRWTRWITSNIKDMTKEFKETANGIELSKTKDDGVIRDLEIEETNADGETIIRETNEVEVDFDGASQEDIDFIKSKNGGDGNIDVADTKAEISSNSSLNEISKVLNSKAVKAAAAIGEYGCALLEGLVSIYTVVSAYQSLQFLNLISGYLEAVDKVKAGEGNSSPINEYNNNMTITGVTTDDDGSVVSNNKTAMQSSGIAWLFGSGAGISQNDPSVRNVNFESVMSNTSGLFDNFGTMAGVYEKCGYVKAGVAAIDLTTTIISFIPLFGQGIKAVQMTAKEVGKIAIKAVVQVALYMVIPIAAKNLANMMIKNAATEWFGEDLGNAIVSGASKYLGGNGTSGGQGPGGDRQVLTYLAEKSEVIAEESRYQRSIRGQFDISSPYTFLGTIIYPLLPMFYSNNTLMGVINNSSGIIRSSLASLSPAATAISVKDALNSVGECGLLESVGAVGDAFCNPYIITDVSTIKESPVTVSDIVHRMNSSGNEIAANNNWIGIAGDNFDSDGKIAEGKDLANYITYCGTRTSQYGIKDASIAERLTRNSVTNVVDYIPGLNDISAIYEGISEEANMAWVNGRACVASDDNPYWEKNKWFQRYTENERLLENMNPGYVSPVTAYIQEHYEKNPVDDSFEGQIARFSGMSKEGVEDTLALMEYYDFISNYDAAARYAFGMSTVEEPHNILFENENIVAESMHIVLLNEISFADVRNRSFVV